MVVEQRQELGQRVRQGSRRFANRPAHCTHGFAQQRQSGPSVFGRANSVIDGVDRKLTAVGRAEEIPDRSVVMAMFDHAVQRNAEVDQLAALQFRQQAEAVLG